MARRRYTVEQIIAKLREAEAEPASVDHQIESASLPPRALGPGSEDVGPTMYSDFRSPIISFLGLGVSLLFVDYLYQRFVFREPSA